jgi:hypothetical protein
MDELNLFGETVSKRIQVNRDDLKNRLFDLLSVITIEEFSRLICNEFDETIQYMNLLNGISGCQKTSLLFNPHRLNIRCGGSKNSIYEALKTINFIDGLSRAILFKEDKVKELLYQVLQLGINGVQYCNEYPPIKAQELCIKFNVSASGFVLDPCAGWGGRMIGVSTVCNHYDCFEPSTNTYNGLLKLAQFIQTMQPDFNPLIHKLPFEDAHLNSNYYDFAITSPPYYDTEIYSDENTNSMNRYKDFTEWCNKFYIPLIRNTMISLKPGKTFVLNIGSRKYPLSEILLSNFQTEYKIEKMGNYLSGNSGLGKTGEGEMFYSITKGLSDGGI